MYLVAISLLKLIYVKSLLLYNNEFLDKYKSYCSSYYSPLKINDNLKKIIVIFRHGDRAPLSFYSPNDNKTLKSNTQNPWETRNCINCTNNECSIDKCRPGELTIKGYEQGELLGDYISKNYLNKFNLPYNTIIGVHTGINRTQTMLNAVMKKLDVTHKSTVINSNLINTASCFNTKNKNTKFQINESKILKFDRIMTSICNDIPYECNDDNCNFNNIADFLDNIEMQFQDKMTQIRENIAMNGSIFSYYADQLLKYIDSPNPIVLLSTHDSTINRILNGLNVNYSKFPSYSAAIFIEFYQQDDKEYIRINYNGNLLSFGLYKEQYITLDQFKKLLHLYAKKYMDVKRICNDVQTFKNKKAKLIELFKPLENAIKTEKKFISSPKHIEEPNNLLNTILNTLSNLLSFNKKSFVLGWFKNKFSNVCGSVKNKIIPVQYDNKKSTNSKNSSTKTYTSVNTCNTCNKPSSYQYCNPCNKPNCNNECYEDKPSCFDNCPCIKSKPNCFSNTKKTVITNCDLLNCGVNIKNCNCQQQIDDYSILPQVNYKGGCNDCLMKSMKINFPPSNDVIAPSPCYQKDIDVAVNNIMRSLYG
ncbi:histidinol phosphatase [Enterocytozoon bieneusi H348]|nr:histidinol phosphatase [Enterocytozoon bieneusi H348]|eukprot:XP_001828078.1 histidinol phosphatase [Enterocytozoon bieneusi H348]